MELPCRITGIVITALIAFGCARHPAAEPVPTPATRERTSAAPQQPGVDKIIVAKVNGVELSMDALLNMMSRLAPGDTGAAPYPIEEHKKRSLEKLILQELAYQQAKAQGVSIGSDKIDMAIANFKENMGGETAYAEYLAKMNVTEANLRAQVRRSLTIELIYAQEVLAKVRVPEDEVRQEYEKKKHLYILPEKASVIDVFVMKAEGKASRERAVVLMDRINADKEKNPWKLVLDGSFIVRDLDVNKERERELFEAARKLRQGELSGVLETPSGSHIVKLKTYSPERRLTLDEVRGRIELKFKVPAQAKRMEEWERELKSGAKIELIGTNDKT